MAYNRKNKLLQVQKVIEIYQREKRDGVTTRHIYRNCIFPIYPISVSTFYNYLTIPVTKLLKEIEGTKKTLDK